MDNLLLPAFPDNPVAIASSSSKEYAPYLAVFLQSIKAHISKEKKYDFIIFESTWPDYLREKFISLFRSDNFSIRFINPEPYIEGLDLYITASHYKRECYYRILAPVLLKKFKKILFTDLDLIAQEDISILLEKEYLLGRTIGACTDPSFKKAYQEEMTVADINIKEYTNCVLKIKPEEYYNTGVLLIDVEKYLEQDAFNKIINLISNNYFIYQEQCALNCFFRGKIATLPPEWNCQINNGTIFDKELNEKYLKKITKANIYHFLGVNKVWFATTREKSDIWWKYARQTPFYEEIITNLINFRILKLKKELKNNSLFNRIKRKINRISLVFFPLNTRRRKALKRIVKSVLRKKINKKQ